MWPIWAVESAGDQLLRVMSAHPQPVRRLGAEVAVDEIARRPNPFVAERRSRSRSATDAGKAFLFHQPCDALAARCNARLLELGVDAWGAIGLLRGLVDLADPGLEVGIAPSARARCSALPRIKAGPRDTERTATSSRSGKRSGSQS